MAGAAQYLSGLERWFGARYSADTVSAAMGQARRFLVAMGKPPPYTRADVAGYVDGLIRAGYRRRSITTIMGHVKTLFVACDWPWPLDRRAMHLGLPEGEANAPALSRADVAQLIAGASQERGIDAAAVALATTWGFRAVELASLFGTGVDGLYFSVQSAKGGHVRRHNVPPVLRPYCTIPKTPVTRAGLHSVFDRVMNRWCRPPRDREGWHSIRRAVVTGLMEVGCDELAVVRFMGWHRGGIALRYWERDPAVIEAPIYPVHPFLPLWAPA